MKESLNVLVIAPHYHTFIKGFVEGLSPFLHEVNVFVHHNYLTELSRFLPSKGYVGYVRRFTKNSLINLNEKPKNVTVWTIPLFYLIPDGRNILLGDKIVKKFRHLIKKEEIKFDLIHAHFIWPLGYVGAKLKEEFKVPLIITAHGYDVYKLPFENEKLKQKIVWALHRADYIVTVSGKNRDIITQILGIQKEKVSVLPNGFDNRLFYPRDKRKCREQLELPQNKKIILNIANLTPIKGHKYLIEAIKIATKYRKDVLCIIIGDGILKKELEELVKDLDLKKYIKFTGIRPHEEIPIWMNAADVFVLSSLKEGNPTVMFEALGVGLPFIGTEVGGIPEVITSENYGLLVKPANPNDLAEKILIALEKEWDRRKIRKYAEKFSWTTIAKKTLKIYKALLDI